MSFLSREEILAAKNRRTIAVDVPELGGKLLLATPSAKKSAEFLKLGKLVNGDQLEQMPVVVNELMPLMLHALVVDEHKRPVFPDLASAAEAVDVLSIDTFWLLFNSFNELMASAATKDAAKKLKAEGSAEGNA